MPGPDDDRSFERFEDRLTAARARHGLDASVTGPTPADTTSTSAMGIGLRVGVELVSAVAVAVGIGWLLDRWLHTMPLFTGIFVLLGGAAGVLNVWRAMGRMKTSRNGRAGSAN